MRGKHAAYGRPGSRAFRMKASRRASDESCSRCSTAFNSSLDCGATLSHLAEDRGSLP